MTEQQFWEIIEQSRVELVRVTDPKTIEVQQAQQLAQLQAALKLLVPAELLAFAVHFNIAEDRLYRGMLREVHQMVNGFGSDDGFIDFCRWLISQGKETFELAVANPDLLAGVVPEVADEDNYYWIEFEGFAYVVADVYEDKTGTPFFEVFQTHEPYFSYQSIPEDAHSWIAAQDIPIRLPQMWKRFGK